MKRNLSPEAIDDPQIPEFAAWRSYRKSERRVKRYRRHIWDREIEAFLKKVMQTRQGRDAEILKDTILWRAQLGVDYVPLKDEDGQEFGDDPMEFSGTRMKPVAEYAREGRANSSGIPVLYLASTEQAAIFEVRPWVGTEVSVAQFRVTASLVLSLKMLWGTPPRMAKTETWSSKKASVVSAG